MKQLTAVLTASFSLAVIVCLSLSGCSKATDTKSPSGTGPESGAASATPTGPVALKIKWTVGKEYALRMETTQNSEMNVPKQPKPVKQVMNMTVDYSISILKELADGGRELEIGFTAGKMDSTVDDRKVLSFDSAESAAHDTNAPELSLFRKMIGEHIRLLTDADGKVEKVEGFEELAKRMTVNSPPQRQALFRRMFNEDSFKQLGTIGQGMPDHPVKVGDSWTVKMEVPNAIGIIVLNLKNTLKAWEQHDGRQCARWNYKGDISSKPGETTANSSVKIESGKLSGEVWFDPALGMVVDTTGEQDMTMQIKGRGRIITGQTHQKISLKLMDVTEQAK
jgi:hypothetical protein